MEKVKAKKQLYVILIVVIVLWLLSSLVIYVKDLSAEEMTINEINKSYAEQTIVYEMQFIKMWEYTENMTEKEYAETFYKEGK